MTVLLDPDHLPRGSWTSSITSIPSIPSTALDKSPHDDHASSQSPQYWYERMHGVLCSRRNVEDQHTTRSSCCNPTAMDRSLLAFKSRLD